MANGAARAIPRKIVPPVWLYDVRVAQGETSLTPIKLLPYNAKRVSVLFAPANSNAIQIWISQRLTEPFGFSMDTTDDPLRFDFSKDGPLVCSEWWVRGPGGSTNVMAIEVVAM